MFKLYGFRGLVARFDEWNPSSVHTYATFPDGNNGALVAIDLIFDAIHCIVTTRRNPFDVCLYVKCRCLECTNKTPIEIKLSQHQSLFWVVSGPYSMRCAPESLGGVYNKAPIARALYRFILSAMELTLRERHNDDCRSTEVEIHSSIAQKQTLGLATWTPDF